MQLTRLLSLVLGLCGGFVAAAAADAPADPSAPAQRSKWNGFDRLDFNFEGRPAILVLPAENSFDDFLREHETDDRLRHVVVVKGDQIFGVLRLNMGLRRGLESARTGMTIGEIANRSFTIVGEDMVASDVIERIWRRNAFMAVVTGGNGIPRASDVRGVITREHVANSVAEGIRIYPR